MLQHTLLGLVGLTGPVRFTDAEAAGETATTLAVLGAATGLLIVATLLRPAHGPRNLTVDDERRLRALLARHGQQDSLGFFALRRDKSVIFSPTGKAAIGYPRPPRGQPGQR